jgi:uncharacterized membrane protein HdeD (DUF308 family)
VPYLPYRGWQIFGGILVAIGGVVIISSPLDSVWALALLSGIWLVIIGIWEVVEAFVIRKHLPEILDVLR